MDSPLSVLNSAAWDLECQGANYIEAQPAFLGTVAHRTIPYKGMTLSILRSEAVGLAEGSILHPGPNLPLTLHFISPTIEIPQTT